MPFDFTFAAAASLASMAVESTLMCPTTPPPSPASTIAPWTRSGSLSAANAANARENVTFDGTSSARSQPHSVLTVLDAQRKSSRARVVGRFHTALAMNASAMDFLWCGLRPLPRHM